MEVWVPAGRELTEGWRQRLVSQAQADENTRKIAAHIAEEVMPDVDAS
jgi:hypothetical protein